MQPNCFACNLKVNNISIEWSSAVILVLKATGTSIIIISMRNSQYQSVAGQILDKIGTVGFELGKAGQGHNLT